MVRWFKVGAALLALAVVGMIAGSAMAQPGGRGGPGGGPGGQRGPGMFAGPGGPGGGGMGILGLLRIEQVQKEIELLDDQKADLEKLGEKAREAMREVFGDFRNLSREEMQQRREEIQKKMQEQQKKLQAEVEKILLPHQLERLEQIRIQLMGIQALNDPEVAKKLNITDAQKEKIQKVQEQAREKMREAFQGMRGGDGQRPDPEAMRERFTKLREQIEKDVLAVLTSEQKKKFEELKGEPFELDRSALFRGRGQGQGPGQGRFQGRGGQGGPRGGGPRGGN
ncbi:hypothetical protein JCM19992_34240 [Thermostilla marina]